MLASNKTKLRAQSGFTLVELLVVITITSALSIAFFGIIMNYYVAVARDNMVIDMTVDSQNLLRSTVEEIRYGAGVRQSNAIIDSHGPAPSGVWNTSQANFVIIIAVPAVDSSNSYIIDAATGQPYNNELVYFKSGSQLYKRTLANPNATGNSMVTSCPQANAAPGCPVDRLLNEYIKTMTFTLYDQDNITTTDPLSARSVKIDLRMERDTFGAPQSLDNSIQVTLRNNFQ